MKQTDLPTHKTKWQLSSSKKLLALITLSMIIIAGIFYAGYPKTTIVMGVLPGQLDSNGELWESDYKNFLSVLKQQGIKLRFKEMTVESSVLELALQDPSIDFLIASNTGAAISTDVKHKFSSLGIVYKRPLFIIANPSAPKLTHLSELKGKLIALRAKPNRGSKVAFIEDGAIPDEHQVEYFYAELFKLLDINYKNTRFINTEPKSALSATSADYYLGFYAVNQLGNNEDLLNKIRTEKYSFINPVDTEGVALKSKAFFAGRLEASTLEPSMAIPSESAPYLFVTQSALVRRNLDPSLVLVLSEALQSMVSSSSILRKANELPHFSDSELFAPSEVAKNYYKNGKPFLANYFSPMAAALLIKILFVLVPLFTILWPMISFAPKIYSFYVKHKITHWYVDLEMIDKSIGSADAETRKKYLEKVELISQSITEMRLPILHTHYVQELFAARVHVNLIRTKLNETKKSNVGNLDG